MKMRSLEVLFAIYGILFFTSPFPIEVVPGSAVSLYRYSVWGLSSLLVLIYHRRALYVARCELWIWGIVALQLLSFVWSISPGVSLDKGREVLQMSTFGLFLATRFNLKEQVRLLAIAFTIAGISSFLLALTLPSVGIHLLDHPGAWKGVYDYKNTLGSYMVMGTVTTYLVATDREAPLNIAWLGVVICSALVFLCTSKTALVGIFLCLGIVYLTQKFRWRGRLAIIVLDFALLVGISLGALITNYWVQLLAGLGKDPTLTGRIPMWAVMIQKIQERPWLGYGRAAFFGPGSPYPKIVGQSISAQFIPPHAHNGFIELALDIGLLGLGLFTISFCLAYLLAIMRAFANRNAGDLWPIAFLTFLLFNNFTEVFLLRMISIFWVLFMAIVLNLAMPQPRRSRSSSERANDKGKINASSIQPNPS